MSQAKTSSSSKCKSFLNLYKLIDVFGEPSHLYYDGETLYRTGIGATITLILVAVLLAISISEIKLTFGKDLRSLSMETVYNAEPGVLDLNTENFRVAVKLSDETHDFSNSKIGIRLRWANFTRDNEGVLVNRPKVSVPLKPCVPGDFARFPKDYNGFGLGQALCADKFNYPLQGVFLSQTFQFLEVGIEKCDNVTHGPNGITCDTEENIEEYFKTNKVRAEIYFISNNLDSKDLNEPFKPYVRQITYTINPKGAVHSSDIFLRETELLSHQSLWGSGKSEWSTFTFDDEVNDQMYFSQKDETSYITVQFRKSNFKINYQRDVRNILTMFAYIGGIWAVLYKACKAFARYLNRLGYEKAVADAIYTFENVEHEIDKNFQKKKVENIECSSPTDSKESRIEGILSKAALVRVKIYENLTSYFKDKILHVVADDEKKRKIIQQDKGIVLARARMDVKFITRKLQEFEKLKYLLLNEKQRALFDYLPPPVIPVPEKVRLTSSGSVKKEDLIVREVEEFKGANLVDNYDSAEQLRKLYEIYKEIKNEQGISQKLISMLGKKAISLFKSVDLISSGMEGKLQPKSKMGKLILGKKKEMAIMKGVDTETPKAQPNGESLNNEFGEKLQLIAPQGLEHIQIEVGNDAKSSLPLKWDLELSESKDTMSRGENHLEQAGRSHSQVEEDEKESGSEGEDGRNPESSYDGQISESNSHEGDSMIEGRRNIPHVNLNQDISHNRKSVADSSNNKA